jgi:hypothetical protein
MYPDEFRKKSRNRVPGHIYRDTTLYIYDISLRPWLPWLHQIHRVHRVPHAAHVIEAKFIEPYFFVYGYRSIDLTILSVYLSYLLGCDVCLSVVEVRSTNENAFMSTREYVCEEVSRCSLYLG